MAAAVIGRKRSISPSRGIPATRLTRTVAVMDIASMIMGGSIASIMWIAFYPWAKLRRLRDLESEADGKAS